MMRSKFIFVLNVHSVNLCALDDSIIRHPTKYCISHNSGQSSPNSIQHYSLTEVTGMSFGVQDNKVQFFTIQAYGGQ